jgi:hypothetical protein
MFNINGVRSCSRNFAQLNGFSKNKSSFLFSLLHFQSISNEFLFILHFCISSSSASHHPSLAYACSVHVTSISFDSIHKRNECVNFTPSLFLIFQTSNCVKYNQNPPWMCQNEKLWADLGDTYASIFQKHVPHSSYFRQEPHFLISCDLKSSLKGIFTTSLIKRHLHHSIRNNNDNRFNGRLQRTETCFFHLPSYSIKKYRI